MFTGLIEEMGTIHAVHRSVLSEVLTIGASTVLEDAKIGDSIAVNGICLTITSRTASSFTVDVMHETLNRSSLVELRPGSRVNLERAMLANGRFGGHIVSGHVDGTGHITNIRKDDIAHWYTVSAAPNLLRYIVEKGSITIDGISLTVACVTDRDFSVSVIPHTSSVTTLGRKSCGDVVNLETDILGKYIEKLITPAETPSTQSHLTLSFLKETGF